MKTAKLKGFTLIELLLVVFIMVTLLSVVLANFGGTSGSRNLKIGREDLISDLRRMQSQSLSAHDIAPGVISSDYFISLATAPKPPSTYTTNAEDNNPTPGQHQLSTSGLPANIYIKQIAVARSDGTNTTASSLKVYFTVPYARLVQTFSGGSISQVKEANDITTITLSTSDNSSTLTFTINGISGNIGP